MKLNDIHSQLNPCTVDKQVMPADRQSVISAVESVKSQGKKISVGGRYHSMGGQPYARNSVNLSCQNFSNIIEATEDFQSVKIQPGITWDILIDKLDALQQGRPDTFSIIQKQTGADRLSLGGALSSNIHGRGLALRPFIHDIISFELLLPDQTILKCSQSENAELFSLVAGGYGLFGMVLNIELKLAKRSVVERTVAIADIEDLAEMFELRTIDGYAYGDFQFATCPDSREFMRTGVFSCYRPVDDAEYQPTNNTLTEDNWKSLIALAHTDKSTAWQAYRDFYLSTNGQKYLSDKHQLSIYVDNYHEKYKLSELRGISEKSTEMILEIYCPIENLTHMMDDIRQDFKQHDVNLIYGTIRKIKQDKLSFLRWAKKDFACIVFNLNVIHSSDGIRKSQRDFQRLIERAIKHSGNFYLTYNAWATHDQVLHCYPEFPEFLKLKAKYDPDELFVSDWYYHYLKLLS